LLDEELPRRDSYERQVFRPVLEGTSLQLGLLADLSVVGTVSNCTDHGLFDIVAGARVPDWRTGWSSFARDESISDVVSYYFDRLCLYITRSAMLNCTAAISMAYAVDCTFQYGSWRNEFVAPRGGAWGRPLHAWSSDRADSAVLDFRPVARTSPRQRYFTTVATQLNALDPHLHRILYCYVRALRLRNEEFWEDCVSSLDAAVRIAADLVATRTRTGQNRYQTMVEAFGLNSATDATLGQLRALRNYFGAHPGEAGFWDFPDDRADDVIAMFAAVQQIIWASVRFETAHRRLHLPAGDWSSWFRQHAYLLNNIVWRRLTIPRSDTAPLSRQRAT
jgi:hypothetical protein